MPQIRLKRAYDPPEPEDGMRVLVERLWPRGVKKEALALDEWLKDIAPSPELRKWYAHEVEKWEEFRRRYEAELDGHPNELAHLRELVAAGPVTFVYAASDEQHNSARVLKEYIERGSG